MVACANCIIIQCRDINSACMMILKWRPDQKLTSYKDRGEID